MRHTRIQVQEIFNSLQGEGFWHLAPVTFVRLFGCPVQCHYCDQGYGDGGAGLDHNLMSIPEILDQTHRDRVVVTGGEPTIHPALPELIHALRQAGKTVHLETSGSHWDNLLLLPGSVWITLSPKEHLNARYPVHPAAWTRANEVKLVIETGAEVDFYRSALESYTGPVFLQPEWNTRDRTFPLAHALAAGYGWRVSVQAHKLLDLP